MASTTEQMEWSTEFQMARNVSTARNSQHSSDFPRDGVSHCGDGVLPLTLARLTGEFLDLANLLADTDPSDADGVAYIERLLNESAAAVQDKAVAIASLIREFDAVAGAAQTEAERILAHSRAAKSRADWLRSYLLKNLRALGVERIQTATTLVAVRQSPPAVEVVDDSQIPDAFSRVIRSIDKSLLRAVLLTGEIVPGARLIRGAHLWIR